MEMPSGTGHDATRISEVGMPIGMLFIPCKEGMSHSPNESARTEDIVEAAQVLAKLLTDEWN